MLDLLQKSDITDVDYVDIRKFLRTDKQHFSDRGQDLMERVSQASQLYRELSESHLKKIVTESKISVPGADTFLNNFNTIYKENEKFRSSLLVGLMRAYSCKISGQVNCWC